MINVRGAQHAYVTFLKGTFFSEGAMTVKHAAIFDAADSDDEAMGRGMRAAEVFFPKSLGWSHHFAQPVRISDVRWVAPHDFSRIVPVEPGK
jgi:hypothetical protein